MNIAIIPSQKNLYKNKLFDIQSSRDDVLERFVLLKAALENDGRCCQTFDQFDQGDIDVVIFTRLDHQARDIFRILRNNTSVSLIYTAIEPEVICPFHREDILGTLPLEKVLTWNDTAVKKFEHITKCNIGEPVIDVDSVPFVAFSNKIFCCMVATNKESKEKNQLYSERLKAIKYFSKCNCQFDLYGIGWDTSSDPDVVRSYRGSVDRKIHVMKKYRFAICYENTKNEMGLITEKIFDCFAAGCVPVYLGACNVEEYIPKTCFIDFRNFKNYDELYSFMMDMTEHKYNLYMEEVLIFLKSKGYENFTSKSYVEIVARAIKSSSPEKQVKSLFRFKLSLLAHMVKNYKFYFSNISRIKRYVYDLMFIS